MVEPRRLTQLVDSASQSLDLPAGRLTVGLSGGADSATLGYFCVNGGRETRGVHINHGLANSALMEKAASEVAAELGIDLEVRNVVVPQGPSPEGQARAVRYSEFAAATTESDSLLTAHTRDDVVETVLFNMIRGTGPKGLGGIPYYRAPNVFRPMLRITRSATREIASLADLSFVDDPMNDQPDLTRNIVRSRVIPMLSELNPRVPDSIARMAEVIASDNIHLDWEAAHVPLLVGEHSVAVAVGELVAVPNPVGDRVLKTMLTHLLGSGGVSAERVGSLWLVARGQVEQHQLSPAVVAFRRGPLLVVESAPGRIDNQSVVLTPGSHQQGRIVFDVLSHDEICQVVPLSRWSAVFRPTTVLEATADGVVSADGKPAWVPGEKRMPVAWYEPGSIGYLSVFAREESGWTSSP